jgi:tetratricopeptide (TPR) repeat protein
MTTPEVTVAPEPGPSETRPADLVLAGVHLRLGSLALARAELETIAAQGGLDRSGRVDLAEVRWRTGDLFGAGDAAREALAGGDDALVALVVAAEAAAALGRPTEARRLAGLALAASDGRPIDPVFAGMPRSGVWPADPAEPVPSPTTLFPPDRPTGASKRPPPGPTTRDGDAADVRAAAATTATGGPSGAAAEMAMGGAGSAPGFWDLPAIDPSAAALAVAAEAVTPPPGLDPAAVLDAGEAALAAGDYASAALHLGLAVRVAPSIAPIILEAIGDTPDAGLQMVRGDAYRAVGRETDARRAYEAAMAAAGSAVRIDPPTADLPAPDPSGSEATVAPMMGIGDLEALGDLDDVEDPDDDSDPFAGEP